MPPSVVSLLPPTVGGLIHGMRLPQEADQEDCCRNSLEVPFTEGRSCCAKDLNQTTPPRDAGAPMTHCFLQRVMCPSTEM